MSQPTLGEIRMFCGNFAPVGWTMCNGQLMSIAENAALFTLIGTTYGGDGVQTFGLPDLRGRIPIHQGTSTQGTYVIGQLAGTETVTLTTAQLPGHTHPVQCSTAAGTTAAPGGNVWAGNASSTTIKPYSSNASGLAAMNAGCVTTTGGSQPHDNLMPFVCLTFIIALEGIFPTRN